LCVFQGGFQLSCQTGGLGPVVSFGAVLDLDVHAVGGWRKFWGGRMVQWLDRSGSAGQYPLDRPQAEMLGATPWKELPTPDAQVRVGTPGAWCASLILQAIRNPQNPSP
jgi:hypothetical protein